jgi:glycosyltransferase involved in cell wall biosynthesis
MNIIVNATNLRKGGALQVCLSFIEELKFFSEHNYYIFLSPAFLGLIDLDALPSHIKTHFFDFPSRFVLFDKTIQQLNQLENTIKPDCVFTVFGPSYWLPKSRHVMGFANGIHLYKDLPYLKNLSLLAKLKWFLLGRYHRFLLKHHTDKYIVETEDVKIRLSDFLAVPQDKIHVTPNTFHSVFNIPFKDLGLLPDKAPDEFRLVSVTAFYPHKNLTIINELIPYLAKSRFKFRFILTLPDAVFEQNFSTYRDYFYNVGPVRIEDCPYIYSMADALFLPTLVESFTASYPEAMKMQKPILTSDYSFSRSVCNEAALYFDPFNPLAIADQIMALAEDKNLYNSLVEKGLNRLCHFPSARDRAKDYINVCNKVINND